MQRFKFVSMTRFKYVSMLRFKLALVISTITIFALACNGDTTVTNQTPGTNTTANVNANATSAATPAGAQTTTTSPDEFAAARATYNATCVRCHKQNGEGGVVEFDEGKKLEVPNFKTGHALTHTDAQFARKIANGGDGMPAFKDRLTPEQIDELVRFVRHEFQAGLIKDSAIHEAGDKH